MHCTCEPDELVQRITKRAASRHAAHRDIARLREFDDGQGVLDAHAPIGLGALVVVDTTFAVDVDVLASDVEAHLASERG
ncbi:MAG: hypothetical protein ACHQIG_10225 [Acidimicrobiia bacterium]